VWQRKKESGVRDTVKRLTGMRPGQIPDGASLLAVTVFRLSRMLKSDVTRTVSKEPGVGLVSWRVFMGLSMAPEATQKELVTFSRIEQGQLSRVLKDMETRGLITSRPSDQDKRARVFALTQSGRKKHHDMLPRMIALADTIDTALSPEEQQTFLDMCARIAAAAEVAAAQD
jgi:DNA-binding MarR family transcriptional regulator